MSHVKHPNKRTVGDMHKSEFRGQLIGDKYGNQQESEDIIS